jgi:hypothetical protein
MLWRRTSVAGGAPTALRPLVMAVLLGVLCVTQLAAVTPLQQEPIVFYPDDPLWVDRDDHDIPPPAARESSVFLDGLMESLTDPTDDGTRALNINTLDEVPDSTWFTNRHGRSAMSIEELRQGPDRAGPPADGDWLIVDLTAEGRTPKLTIEDAREKRYIVKLDSPDYPELMSSTEVICTKFFHAFGYHVPENYVVTFDPGQLVQETAEGEREAATIEFLDAIPRNSDGRIRAVASLYLPGKPLGPFAYEGTRPDDPNDIFPHQHRRELRGLLVFAAWLNHTDVKAGNSLDMLIEEDDRAFVRHHLIDFGSALGSAAVDVKDPLTGYERYFEPQKMVKSMLSLGLWVRPYLRIDYPEHPAVGNLEADYYEPWLWKPPIANPAFQLADAADVFWAARIVSRFDDEAIRAVVSTAKLSDPEAEELLAEILIERRDKTVAWFLTRTNPLDGFRLQQSAAGRRLLFENVAETVGAAAPRSSFTYRWFRLDNRAGILAPAGDEATTGEPSLAVPEEAWGPPDARGLRYATVEISTSHPGYPHWREPVAVTLRLAGGEPEVVGVRRPREMLPAEVATHPLANGSDVP